MAMSSILESVKLKDPKEIEEFANALLESDRDPKFDYSSATYEFVTDPDRIRQILKKDI